MLPWASAHEVRVYECSHDGGGWGGGGWIRRKALRLLTFDNQVRNRKGGCSTRRPDRRATPARCPTHPPERPHAKSNQMKLPSPKCAGKPRFGCFWHLRAQRWAERRRAQRRRGRPRRGQRRRAKKNQHFHSVFFRLTSLKKTKSGSVDIKRRKKIENN